MNAVLEQISKIGIVPVVKIDNAADALPLAKALCAGGLPCAEVTFRTSAAAEAIKIMTDNFPSMCVGAGTVLNAEQVDAAVAAGAKFIVSPGYSEPLLTWCRAQSLPFFPGIATASELQKAVCDGMTCVKFFPAEQAGGVPMLKALGAVFSQVKFMPTGGIGEKNLADYLALPNVLACGGSWLCPKKLIREENYGRITEICRGTLKTVSDIRV